jgi:DNA end-binding protein Ku
MLLLHHDQQVTRPALIEEDLVPVAVSVQERELARTLVEASTAREFALAKYQDVYTEKLTRLIEAKVAGEEIVAPPQEEHAQVINLMDALRQSVARAQKQQRGANGAAHKAAMTNDKEGRSRKRKSS